MNKHNKRRGLDTYVVFAVIILLVLILIYYALTVGNEKQLSVGITSWTLTSISKAFYPIDIVNITSVFNDSNNQLYLLVEFKNGGSSQIGYLSGCVSALYGKVYPTNIANLSYEKNVASCNAITVAALRPNQTTTVQWPLQPQIINIFKTGNFNVNLTLPFGFYNTTIRCPKVNISCPANYYSFSGFTENATIQVSLSVVN
ncbi:MAG: hypothetical protein QW194_03245 [Candidatus Micrarchaeaceae archaeon]|jgi:hypothetical protein|nr:hypothetical protein [Candidatus Parvarchaeota archaeon]MCW1295918.1 hypothetical protein [Candidatus Parvarchaeum tengchongense]MCW1312041.1 hypothetical protein [Candidatus Parvarchaeum tengchongense]